MILIKYYIILYHIIVLYYTILFYFIYFILYYLILFYIILYHIISYYTYVYTTVYIYIAAKKKFQKCATSKYCLLNESWSLRTSATGPGCVQPLLPQHLGIKAMNHVRQAPESHSTASLEAPVINKSVKKNKM